MKKIIFLAIILLSVAFVHAQEQNYKSLLNSFSLHSQNGFKDIIGEQTDTLSNFYPSKLNADIGEVKINKTSYAVTLNWIIPLGQLNKVQQAVQDFIKTVYADAKLYKTATVGPDDDDPTIITAVYGLMLDGAKPVKVFQAMTDKKQFAITIYAK